MGHRQPIPTEFSERLAALRQVFGMNKIDVARKADISPSLYGRYESGRVEPTLSNILKLMRAFRVDFPTLIGEKPINVLPSGKESGNSA